jgi:hypothetical protein
MAAADPGIHLNHVYIYEMHNEHSFARAQHVRAYTCTYLCVGDDMCSGDTLVYCTHRSGARHSTRSWRDIVILL